MDLMIKARRFTITFAVLLFIPIISSCQGRRGQNSDNKEDIPDAKQIKGNIKEPPLTIKHVSFFIENSGSMNGYVNGATEFVNVVNDLAQFPSIINESNSQFSYYFISGTGARLRTYPLGNDANVLRTNLHHTSFSRPTSGSSDLNKMFEIALLAAENDSISILISDGIYDVGNTKNPLMALETEGIATRTTFINRLKEVNIQTLLIKLSSSFDGRYFPGSSGSAETFNQKRPYYIWIFGNASLINKYFPEQALENLTGFIDVARFQKMEEQDIPYKGIGYENIGLRPTRRNNNSFELSNRHSSTTQLTYAVDFSTLHLSESYITNINNYTCTNGYKVEEIYLPKNAPDSRLRYYTTNLSIIPTHIVRVSSSYPPQLGQLNITFKNTTPSWILSTNTNNDSPLNGDTNHTFGFSTLTIGITEAYEEVSNAKNLGLFTFIIQNN